jgi:hypothetical protein
MEIERIREACGLPGFRYAAVMRYFLFWAAALLALPVVAVDRVLKFSDSPVDQEPSGFRSLVIGAGKPGDWKVVREDDSGASGTNQASTVLAQTARDPQGNHFPVLIFDKESYGDFRLSTRFKIVGGAMEQAAGIVFRFQNESNFYLVGASVLGNSFRCYKVDNGVWKPPFGPEMEISKGTWHDLVVQCEGTRILCSLDGNDAIKLIDNSTAGSAGKVGFWTKSDSVSHFLDTTISYTPSEMLAKTLVRQALQEYPRVLGLKVFAERTRGEGPSIIASKDETEIGQAGGKAESDVILNGTSYYSKDKESVTVTLPLRDRNGDPIAAVRIVMKTFPGQTEDNAVVRAKPIVKLMQAQVKSREELLH